MTPLHIFLAVLVAVIWGIAFVATKLGLESFSPPQLTALRFLIASVPVVLVARPPITWSVLCAVGLTLFAGQFLFQFFGIWGSLLRRYSAATVTPFALLAPFVAAYASSLVFGERFGVLRLAGMGLVLLGLAVIVLPLERPAGRRQSR